MKRSKTSSRTMRARRDTRDHKGNSRYALKVARGQQLYGNGAVYHGGCCAHGIGKPLAIGV